jgi:hypothetical protein
MNGYINLIVFILTTIFYFYSIKQPITFSNIDNPSSTNGLAIYALLILLTQFGLNVWTIIDKCGGSASQNIGVAALFTFLPWSLIFGIILVILIVFPGFKTAFSDVIGYFYISEQAHILFSEMLSIKGEIKDKINKEPDENVKQQLITTAEALIKLCGNMGVLINQIVPSNFNDYWQLLQPLLKDSNILSENKLFKDKQQSINDANEKLPENEKLPSLTNATDFYRDELLKLVISRDNVGEFMWYLYTGILVISIIQYYILSRGCLSDAATMEKNYQAFLQKEQDEQNKKEATQNTTYTITS